MSKYLRLLYVVVPLYLFGYYGWLYFFKNHPYWQTLGGNTLSILGICFALFCLKKTIQRTTGKDRTFWFILGSATGFYLIAELIWFTQETALKIDPPFPGWPDVFYLLQVFGILVGLMYKILHQTRQKESISFIFDILILLVVATTFSWHFIISPILTSTPASKSALIVSLAYPIGDLAILSATTFLFFHALKQKKEISLLLIVVASFIQAFADSIYLYLVSVDAYISGSLIDPLFILVMILIGFAGLLFSPNKGPVTSDEPPQHFNIVQLLTPYGGVLILFLFMGFHSKTFDIVTVGSGISISLVIVRQVWIILENQRLVKNYYIQTQELELSKERYKSLFEYHPDPVYSTDLNGRFDSANKACSRLLETSSHDLIGKSSLGFIEADFKKHVSLELRYVFDGHPRNYETMVDNQKGKKIWMNITNVPIIVQDRLVGIFGIGKDITETKIQQQRIHNLAYFDPLTGLSNRSAFEERLTSLLQEVDEKKLISVSLLFMDLNQFKLVNDSLGHDIGDQLLIAVAKRLRRFEDKFELIARQGGDEFTLLLKDVSCQDELHHIGKLLLEALCLPYEIKHHQIFCSPSIGISCYPSDASSLLEMMKHADLAMYQAKKTPEGTYVFFNDFKKIK